MVGVLITLFVAIGAIGIGAGTIGRWTNGLDPAARLGANGAAGLGSLGLLTLFIGLIPGGLNWGIYAIGFVTLVGIALLCVDLKKAPVKVSFPKGLDGLFVLAFALAVGVSLVGVLAPCDTIEWDSLAYHLAVPKLFIQAGNVYPVFIHQSNFPGVVDYLYIWGLKWGGESGAKAFTLSFLIFGLLSAFGLARQKYGDRAGFWSALAFGFVPVAMWESGTAYIDLSNGVFAGLGITFAAFLLLDGKERRNFWLAAIFLGFAASSKYTGLQTIFAVGLVIVAFTRSAEGLKTAVLIGAVAMAIACPWYIKTTAYTGNPVFPFFYGKLGGKNWDQRRAEIYTNQQYGFGLMQATAQESRPMKTGAAVFGLALEPEKYIDAGQAPVGAVGVAILLSLFLWLISGRATRFEGSVLGTVMVSLAMWVVLSQQSRYIIPLMMPLAVILGGGVKRLRMGMVLAGAAVAQAGFSLWLIESFCVTRQMSVVSGKLTPEEYQKSTISFYEPAQMINQVATTGKVALYDEVFGFLLDVPYMWANPGHSTLIPYDEMKTGADYAAAMKKLGFTHVYVNVRAMLGSKEAITEWYASTGLTGAPVPMKDRDSTLANWEIKYKILIADAIASGELTPVQQFGNGNLLLAFK